MDIKSLLEYRVDTLKMYAIRASKGLWIPIFYDTIEGYSINDLDSLKYYNKCMLYGIL